MLLVAAARAAGKRLGAVVLAEAPQHSHPTWEDFTATTWIAVVLIGIATIWTVWKAVMYTLHPGEEDPGHLKRLILGEPDPLQVSISSVGGRGPGEVGREQMDVTSGSGAAAAASGEDPAGDAPAGEQGPGRDD